MTEGGARTDTREAENSRLAHCEWSYEDYTEDTEGEGDGSGRNQGSSVFSPILCGMRKLRYPKAVSTLHTQLHVLSDSLSISQPLFALRLRCGVAIDSGLT